MNDLDLGCRMPVADWVQLNRIDVFGDPALRRHVAPFPPPELMQNVSGLVSEADFASHGADFWIALSEASPKPLAEYRSVLDFGCGCGRLARMFKGHPGRVAGCDIDARHIAWVRSNLEFVDATASSPKPPIPYADNEFEAVISISIFTHLNERSQDEFLSELARVTSANGRLFITVHGATALSRAINEPRIRDMLSMPEDRFRSARKSFADGGYGFVRQEGHLTTEGISGKQLSAKVITEPFEYGITFIPEAYLRRQWARWFDVEDYRPGALHGFQDLAVLRPRK